MSKYRKKPVVIEAFRFGYDKEPEWLYDAISYEDIQHCIKLEYPISSNLQCYDLNCPGHLIIYTLEGEMRANWGDYIIKGVKGELYPCKADIFEETYEKVE